MRKMKRGLSLVLASIMATALVGCSGGENTETTNTATTTENKETTGTTQVADENQEEITLRFVSWQTIMMNRTKRLRQHTRNSILILMCSLIM